MTDSEEMVFQNELEMAIQLSLEMEYQRLSSDPEQAQREAEERQKKKKDKPIDLAKVSMTKRKFLVAKLELAPERLDQGCLICYEEYEDEDVVVTLGCKGQHCFHEDCIEPWLVKSAGECPCCKEKVVNDDCIEVSFDEGKKDPDDEESSSENNEQSSSENDEGTASDSKDQSPKDEKHKSPKYNNNNVFGLNLPPPSPPQRAKKEYEKKPELASAKVDYGNIFGGGGADTKDKKDDRSASAANLFAAPGKAGEVVGNLFGSKSPQVKFTAAKAATPPPSNNPFIAIAMGGGATKKDEDKKPASSDIFASEESSPENNDPTSNSHDVVSTTNGTERHEYSDARWVKARFEKMGKYYEDES